MIPRDIFDNRRDNYCSRCEHWQGVCLKGHKLSSPMGCPVKKFPPVNSAAYMDDVPVPPRAIASANCRSCSDPGAQLAPLRFRDVMKQFGTSMATWVAEGLPLADKETHGARYAKCKPCEHYANHVCQLCKCVAYAKTKLATEKCPAGFWGPVGRS